MNGHDLPTWTDGGREAFAESDRRWNATMEQAQYEARKIHELASNIEAAIERLK